MSAMKIAVLQKLGANDYQVCYIEVPDNFFEAYTNEGMSVRGTLNEVLGDIKFEILKQAVEEAKPDPYKEFRKRMMTASISELYATLQFLQMAFGDEEYADNCIKLEILKQVVEERGLDK
jgi:hypothetical protein